MRIILTSILLVLVTSGSPAYSFELVPHSASYTANIKKGIQISGKAVRKLKQLDESTWKYSFDVRSFAADIDESVTFTANGGQIVPMQYRYKLDPVFGRTKKARTDFDWEKGRVDGANKNKPWSFEGIESDTYDRLSYQLQLLKDLANTDINPSYKIAHKAKLRPTTFEKVGTETLETALGNAETTVVRKVRQGDNKRQTYLWISNKYPMLLVKMTQTEKDGEQYEIHLESAEVNGKDISFYETEVELK